MKLKKLHVLLGTAFGACGLAAPFQHAMADGLPPNPGALYGQYRDVSGVGSTTGAVIAASGPLRYLTLGLNTVGNDFNGDISKGIMAASAAGGLGSYGGNYQQGSGQSRILYSTSITNSGTTANAYRFNINLANSRLTVVNDFSSNGFGTAVAFIKADVKVNGASVWSSSASLASTSNEAQSRSATNPPRYFFNTTGAAFVNSTVTTAFNGRFYAGTAYQNIDFANYTNTISLGILQPGQTDNITYELDASAQLSNLSDPAFTYVGYGGAVAHIGDPFGVDSTPSFAISAVSPVPEPEAAALMAAGLLLLGTTVRRRKKTM